MKIQWANGVLVCRRHCNRELLSDGDVLLEAAVLEKEANFVVASFLGATTAAGNENITSK